jgi:hypothetical protein
LHFSRRKPTKTWERTRLRNLVRHKSGRYYARAFAGGKEVWKSLKTSHFSVAEAKLAEFLKEHRRVEQLTKDFESKIAQQQKQIEVLTARLQKVSAQVELKTPAPQTVLNQ